MNSARPAGSRRKRESTLLLLCSLFLAAAVFAAPAEGSLPRAGLQDANPAVLAGAEAVDSGQLLATGLETPFSLIMADDLKEALACNPAPEAGGLNLVESSLLEPPELTSRACAASFSLHMEAVDFGLNPQRGPPFEIPDLHQGEFVADPRTRIGGFGLELEDLIKGECPLSPGLRRGYEVEGWGNAEEERPDPWGLAVDIIVGRPYRKASGDWSPYGHVAIRVHGGKGKKRYDVVYDFGRYGAVSWSKMTGEGILNVRPGPEYLDRESRERASTAYRVETDEKSDRAIMNYYQKQIDAGKRRQDIEKKLGLGGGGRSYELEDEYDAAPVTGIGRNTCVTKTREGCQVSGTTSLADDVAEALDELKPQNVEKNLDALVADDGSPIAEKRFYPRGNSKNPVVVTAEEERAKSAELRERERKLRDAAWEEPVTKKPTPKGKRK